MMSMISTLKSWLPWWIKPLVKWGITRLPISYRQWARLGLFRHGQMDNPEYAFRVFRQHFERAKPAIARKNFVGLELGPGDSVSSAVIAAAFGAAHYYLVDVGEFAATEIQPYRELCGYMKGIGLSTPEINEQTSFPDILKQCNAQYLTHGLESLTQIPTASVDYIWSHGVLQSIHRSEFDGYLRELRRILRPDGACSHYIALKDCMRGELNHLRFSEQFWESKIVAASGYYYSQIRYEEMLNRFRATGFTPTVSYVERWSKLPIDRGDLAEPFRNLPDDDLLVSVFSVLLQPIEALEFS